MDPRWCLITVARSPSETGARGSVGALRRGMRLTRSLAHRAIGAAVLVLMTACLPRLPQRPPVTPEPSFDPTRFFAGRTRGEGTLHVRFGGDRALRVLGVGRDEADGTFRLEQTITFGDGAVETRVWRLRRADAAHFTGVLSDAKGEVRAESRGNLFHLRYLVRRPAVYMEQWLYLQPDGRTVRNLARVTVLGVPWATLAETITRDDGGR